MNELLRAICREHEAFRKQGLKVELLIHPMVLKRMYPEMSSEQIKSYSRKYYARLRELEKDRVLAKKLGL